MSIAINLLTSHIFPQRNKTKTRHKNVRLAKTILQEVTGEIHSSNYLAIRKTVNMYLYMSCAIYIQTLSILMIYMGTG